ncbi:hypothetical protein HUK65_06925 [Rhodobacteraceae bacterium 2376]|uniref:Uncharacterized protein n=1 Tax=Rhabdonatronobacter sediminivivens TaxID=2743469 RepID=A0A7Z0HYM6_9RHOB|nr:hypothetical protein [Rhabdonatronobacter sediminivivens]NYS24723.1 hypothetical protein [Rhabdonatronobacter sediminivivens]
MKQESSSRIPDRPDTVMAHVRLTNPQATVEERRAAQQARVGILRNPAEPKLTIHPPRDVWRKWPRLRSNRRNGASGTILQAEIVRRAGTDDPATGEARHAGSPDGRALHSQTRALHQALHVQQQDAPPRPESVARPGPAGQPPRHDAAPGQDRQRARNRAGPNARAIAPAPGTTADQNGGPDTPGGGSMVQGPRGWRIGGLRSQNRTNMGQRHPWPQRIIFALAWGGFCAVIGGVVLRLATGP